MNMVCLCEANTPRGQFVEVRCFCVWIPVATQMRADIFATDPKNIWAIVSQSSPGGKKKEWDREAVHDWFSMLGLKGKHLVSGGAPILHELRAGGQRWQKDMG